MTLGWVWIFSGTAQCISSDVEILKHFVCVFTVQFGTTDGGSKSPAPDDSAAADAGTKYKELVVTLENGVQTIRMNRPAKYNAITLEVEHNNTRIINFNI